MKIRIKSQAGFTIIEIALAIVLFSSIGAAVYLAISANPKSTAKNAISTAPSVTATSPTVPTLNPYKDWETYSSRCASMSFKYPSNWKLTAQSGNFSQFDPCNPIPVNITSPTGNIIVWVPWVYGDGPGCFITVNECPTLNTVTSVPGPISGTKIVKRIACSFEDTTKCEGQIILAKPDPNNKLTFEEGTRKEYPVATFMSTKGKYTAFFMTQSHSTAWGNPPGVNGKYSETEARSWLSSDDANAALLSLQSLR